MRPVSSANTKRLAGYFPAGAHAQNYSVADIPAAKLTHVIYAFANISSAGECVSTNAAEDGVNFPALAQLKKEYPHLSTLISVGGAGNKADFSEVCSTGAGRLKLAKSCAQFMKTNGFDGIDIDWEFPTAQDTGNFTDLLIALRRQLAAQGESDKREYSLTIAAPAGPSNYQNIDLTHIHPQLDWINLMTYDFWTASSKVTNFVAPLFAAKDNPAPAPTVASHNVDAAVKAYLAAGVPAAKVVAGARFVGTGWQGVPNANNGLYQPDKGPARGTWDKAGGAPSGSFSYGDIEQNYVGSYTRFWHPEAQVPWLYSPATEITISYEDVESVGVKAGYVVANGLGGMMIWQLAADDEKHSLVGAMATRLAAKAEASAAGCID